MTSSINASNVSSSAYVNDGSPPGTTVMSPDALLAYCQIQLGDLDDQVTTQMNAQQLALSERTAVQNVQTTLESFGTQGPTNGSQMNTCVVAFQNAIASLPPGDPVAAQLQQLEGQMEQQYGYQVITTPAPQPAPVTSPKTVLEQQAVQTSLAMAGSTAQTSPNNSSSGASATVSYALTHPPANDDWQGTTDAVGNLADNIKSSAEIQMLTLEDLVSQRQQVVELATGMMSKEDETLTDGAKAIGAQ